LDSPLTLTGLRAASRAAPFRIVNILAESDLERLELGEVNRDSEGAAFAAIGSQTVANHLLLSLLPVPNDY